MWVHGWPFRLLLDHLAARHDTSARAVLLAAGLSRGDSRTLMRCTPRWGRIPHRVGVALLRVDDDGIVNAHRRLASARPATVAA